MEDLIWQVDFLYFLAQPGADEDKDKKEVQKSPAVGGDPGQSNPADKDMYTTRDKAS